MSLIALEKAAEYRRKAQEIRTIVEKITIYEAREQLLETAEHLEALAEEEERRFTQTAPRPRPSGRSVGMTVKCTSAQCGRFSPRNRPNRRC